MTSPSTRTEADSTLVTTTRMAPLWRLRIIAAMSVIVWVLIIAAGLTSLLALGALAAVMWTLLKNMRSGN